MLEVSGSRLLLRAVDPATGEPIPGNAGLLGEVPEGQGGSLPVASALLFAWPAGAGFEFVRFRSPGFAPRDRDPELPFQVFTVPPPAGGASERAARIGGIGPGSNDGAVAFLLDPRVSESHRSAIEEAIDLWNEAFDEALGTRPLRLDPAPDPAPDPWDPRSRTIEALESELETSGSTPLLLDPGTGEILDADVVLRVGPEAGPEAVLGLALHEVGHALGLRHNLRGSADRPWHEDGLPSSTVMDQVDGMTRPGPYDVAVIAWLYGGAPPPAGPPFLTCSDDEEGEVGCEPWDVGDPLVALASAIVDFAPLVDPALPWEDAAAAGTNLGLDGVLRDLRAAVHLLVPWDEAATPRPFDLLLGTLACAPPAVPGGSDPCPLHAWVRAEAFLALSAGEGPDLLAGEVGILEETRAALLEDPALPEGLRAALDGR